MKHLFSTNRFMPYFVMFYLHFLILFFLHFLLLFFPLNVKKSHLSVCFLQIFVLYDELYTFQQCHDGIEM